MKSCFLLASIVYLIYQTYTRLASANLYSSRAFDRLIVQALISFSCWANVLKRQEVVSATSWFFYCLNFSNRDACGARFCPNCPLKKPISFPVRMSVALCFPFPNRLVSETETSTASLSFRLNKAKYHSPVFALRDVIATFPSLLNT